MTKTSTIALSFETIILFSSQQNCNGGKPHPPPPVAQPGFVVNVGNTTTLPQAKNANTVRFTVNNDKGKPNGSRVTFQPQSKNSSSSSDKHVPVTVKITVPNTGDLTGQMLTLPVSLTAKLNMSKPLNLKLNGMTYNVPPRCVYVGKQNVKVFLPPKEAQEEAIKAWALAVRNGDEDTQELVGVGLPTDVANLESNLNEVREPKSVASKVNGMSNGKLTGNTFTTGALQKLSGGVDCLTHIFQYLPFTDLLK